MGRSPPEAELIYHMCHDYQTFLSHRQSATPATKVDYDKLWNCIRTFKSTRKLDSLDTAFTQHRALVLNAAARRQAQTEQQEEEYESESFNSEDEENAAELINRQLLTGVSASSVAEEHKVGSRSNDPPATPSRSMSSLLRHYETMDEVVAEFSAISRQVTTTLISNPALRDDFMAIYSHVAHSLTQPAKIRAIRKFLLDGGFLHHDTSPEPAHAQSEPTRKRRGRTMPDTPKRVRQSSSTTPSRSDEQVVSQTSQSSTLPSDNVAQSSEHSTPRTNTSSAFSLTTPVQQMGSLND